MKNTIDKGITLIVLVITIVVLIILASVSINLTLSDNGIFNRAKTAKEQYQNAQEYEKDTIADYSNSIDSYLNNSREYLNVKSGTYIGNGEYGQNKPNEITFEQAPQIVIVSSVGLYRTGYSGAALFIQGCPYTALSTCGDTTKGGAMYLNIVSWENDGKTIKWYHPNNLDTQLNVNGIEYKWVAIF